MNTSPAALVRFVGKILEGDRWMRNAPRIGVFRQFIDNFRLMRLNALEPYEYYRYELCRPEITWAEKSRYLSRDQAWRMHRTINQLFDQGVLQKLVFDRFMGSLGLPVPKQYGFYNPQSGHDADNRPLRTREDFERFLRESAFSEFVLKAMSADRGEGIRLCRKLGGERVLSFNEGELTYGGLFDKIASSQFGIVKHSPDSWLIQERIIQHPFLDRFTADCTQTARVVTYITKGGKIQILMRFLKIARAGKHIDNVGTTGMAAIIAEDGRLGAGAQFTERGVVYHLNHPETNAPIAGETLPFYREVIELAREAQSRLPFLRSLGWDIAITASGPLLIEANAYWSQALQFALGKGVMTEELYEEIHEVR